MRIDQGKNTSTACLNPVHAEPFCLSSVTWLTLCEKVPKVPPLGARTAIRHLQYWEDFQHEQSV